MVMVVTIEHHTGCVTVTLTEKQYSVCVTDKTVKKAYDNAYYLLSVVHADLGINPPLNLGSLIKE